MKDDDDNMGIIYNEYGVFRRGRRATVLENPLCPLCGMRMYQLRRPPVKPTCAGHALWLVNRMVFFACPDKEQPGHQAAERIFVNDCELWSRPLKELLAMDARELFRTHEDDKLRPKEESKAENREDTKGTKEQG